jgi:hypothetical protein
MGYGYTESGDAPPSGYMGITDSVQVPKSDKPLYEHLNQSRSKWIMSLNIIAFLASLGVACLLAIDQAVNDRMDFMVMITKQHAVVGLVTDPPYSARLTLAEINSFNLGWILVLLVFSMTVYFLLILILSTGCGRRIFWIWVVQRRNPLGWFMMGATNAVGLAVIYSLMNISDFNVYLYLFVLTLLMMFLFFAMELVHHPDDKPLLFNPLTLALFVVGTIADFTVWVPVFATYNFIEFDITLIANTVIFGYFALWHLFWLSFLLARTNIMFYNLHAAISIGLFVSMNMGLAVLLFYGDIGELRELVV